MSAVTALRTVREATMIRPSGTRFTAAMLVFAFSLLMSATSAAGETSYKCVINAVMESGENGNPIPASKGNPDFVVDRLSGRIIGSALDNGDFDFKIIGEGSGRSRFLVITETNTGVEYLIIKGHVDSLMKPFTAIDYLGRVYFGLCS